MTEEERCWRERRWARFIERSLLRDDIEFESARAAHVSPVCAANRSKVLVLVRSACSALARTGAGSAGEWATVGEGRRVGEAIYHGKVVRDARITSTASAIAVGVQ